MLKAIRIVCSIVGNRQEAIEALNLAATANIRPKITLESLENLGSVFERMEKGQIAGRVVLRCHEPQASP